MLFVCLVLLHFDTFLTQVPTLSNTFYFFVFLVKFEGLENGIPQTAIYIHIPIYLYLLIYIST